MVGLVGEYDRVQLAATGDLENAVKATSGIAAIREASIGDGSIDFIVDQARGSLPDILAKVTAAGISVRSVEVKEPDLEAVFLHITGKGLRD